MTANKNTVLKIYLDNCCFNRPYDNQKNLRVYLETQAKIYVQDLIKNGIVKMATSFILEYENLKNPFAVRRVAIEKFLKAYSSDYVGVDKLENIKQIASSIMANGIKIYDAYHVACALSLDCDYFLSTDDRLLKRYSSHKIVLLNPLDFVKLEEIHL